MVHLYSSFIHSTSYLEFVLALSKPAINSESMNKSHSVYSSTLVVLTVTMLKSPKISINSFVTNTENVSFWSPGKYNETTKRVENGEKLVRDFIQMVEERRDIEKEYAK